MAEPKGKHKVSPLVASALIVSLPPLMSVLPARGGLRAIALDHRAPAPPVSSRLGPESVQAPPPPLRCPICSRQTVCGLKKIPEHAGRVPRHDGRVPQSRCAAKKTSSTASRTVANQRAHTGTCQQDRTDSGGIDDSSKTISNVYGPSVEQALSLLSRQQGRGYASSLLSTRSASQIQYGK